MGANLPKLDFGVNKVARQIAVGYTFVCARLSNDSVVCWGDNSYGQLGIGDTSYGVGTVAASIRDYLIPANLGTGKVAIQIATGDTHACALLNDHSVKCWGRNEAGELGIGDNLNRGNGWSDMGDNLPAVDLGTGRTAIAVAAGSSTSCAILDNNSVKCWGRNSDGTLGTGDTNNRGDNPGEMGNNLAAIDLGTGKTAVEISLSVGHVCVRLNDASVKCWGFNPYGQLGLGDTNTRGDNPGEMGNNLPIVNLGTGKTATRIAVGGAHSCAVLNDGNVKCWGGNYSGELGLGLPTTTAVGDAPGEMGDNLPPVNLGTGKTVVNIDAGNANNCVILNDGNVKCWGNNYTGQLGIGMSGNRGELTTDMGDNLPALILQ
jgi:alpha-tubulin suppressor-like RCC1 family protein